MESISSKETRRAESLFREHLAARYIRADRMFVALLVAQWIFGITLALVVSPYAWQGKVREFHPHLYAAVFMGGALTLLPVLLGIYRPGWVVTRHVMVASQMLWSALLIHLTGGRIESHFHVFGSLAFASFYYDWKVLLTGTVVVAGDHFVRGLVYPESVYGIVNPEWWRFLEHAGWVVFEDVVLVWSCISGTKEMRAAAQRQSEIESLTESEQIKNATLEMVLKELQPASAS